MCGISGLISYNNYIDVDIRDELKEQGYTFLTNCDTEVIIYAYKEFLFFISHAQVFKSKSSGETCL